MAIELAFSERPTRNPLDIIEDVLMHRELAYERYSPEEIAVEVPGRWCDYRFVFLWRSDWNSLHMTGVMDLRASKVIKTKIYELLARINEKLWIGTFDLTQEELNPAFRYAMLLRPDLTVTSEQIQDLVDIATSECERFYPAFQMVVWGGKTPAEAIQASMLETVGEG